MNDRDILRSERADRVADFGSTNSDDFIPASKGRELLMKLAPIQAHLLAARVR